MLPLRFRPCLVIQEATERLCIIIRQAALRRDVPQRREVSYRFIAHVGSLGGSPRWASVRYDHGGPRSMCVPERHAEGDAAQADHLDCIFMVGVLIDEKKVTNLESGFGYHLKNSGASSCRARQTVYT